MGAVYKILNLVTGDEYIGSTKRLDNRKWCHVFHLKNNKHHSPILQNAWNKYGAHNFDFIIIEEVIDTQLLLQREQFWMDERMPRYNVAKKAGSPLGTKHTDQSRKNMSLAHLGKKLSPESIAKRSLKQSGANHWAFGKVRSDKDKKNVSIGVKKHYADGGKHWNKGNTLSQEMRDRISKKLMKPISQYNKNGELMYEWESSKTAGEATGIQNVNITQCAKGHHKTAGGFTWKYKNV